MDVIVKVTHAELAKLGVNRDQLCTAIWEALDKTILPSGTPAQLDAIVSVEFTRD